MKINKDLEVALKALTVLKTKNTLTRVADISSEIGHNVPHLEQIMRKLKLASIISVKRGPGGGYLASYQTHTAMDVAKALGYTFQTVGELNSPEHTLSLQLVKAFENTHI
jgi:DNA-binding IscR family transcriptional regulator